MLPVQRSIISRIVVLLGVVGFATLQVDHAPHPAAAQVAANPIATENALPGTKNWTLSKPANDHQIEGYASSTSVAPGERIGFSVSTTAPTFTADIFRMGWYGGDGARSMQEIKGISGHTYSIPHPDATTGLVDCRWPLAFLLSIPSTWVTGVYLVRLTASTGYQDYISFVVRSPVNAADFIFVRAVATDAAYNEWGGASLYHDLTGTLAQHRALQVSLNRPSAGEGAGLFLSWEYHMVRWLEHHSYNVSYVTDVDIHEHPELLLHHKAILIAGHDEYWSKEMRDGMEAAVASGVNLGVFGANTGFWQIRFAPSDGVADRIIICYRLSSLDPLNGVDNSRVTTEWRLPPVNRPESTLLGAMYPDIGGETSVSGDWRMAEGVHWPFGGIPSGTQSPIPGIVGYEFDALAAPSLEPQNLVVLGASPLRDINGNSQTAATTFYTAPSGARVFDAGTIQWSWGLDGKTANPLCEAITQALLQDFLTRPSTPLPAVKAVASGTLGNAGWYRSPVTFSLLAGVGTQRMQYSLDAGKTWVAYGAPVTVTQQGLVSLDSHAITAGGLTGQTSSDVVRIDTIPPLTTATDSGPCSLSDDEGYRPDAQMVSMLAQDAGSGVAETLYITDGQTWLPYVHPFALRISGTRPLYYRSVDVAGNLEPVQQTEVVGSPACPL